MLGMNDGSSGSLGGAGSCGIDGMFGKLSFSHAALATLPFTVVSIFIVGGTGSSGRAGSGILFGTK
jgi:hypothetical protein